MKNVTLMLLCAGLCSCTMTSLANPFGKHPASKKTVAKTPLKGGTKISLDLTGGANAGSYSAVSETPTCSMGLTGPKSFGNQYSVSGKKDAEFSSLQLLVDDYQAAKSGTDKFYIKVAFGKRLVGKSYIINGSDNPMAGAKTGGGKLTISETGNTKTATIDGKTKDGVAIKATVACMSVNVMENGKLIEK